MRSSPLHDLRDAVRGLARAPGFTALAALTLALGVGSATAVFSLVNGVLLRPLPYHEPERLVNVWSDMPGVTSSVPTASALNARDYRQLATRFEGFSMALGVPDGVTLGADREGQDPERVELTQVSANFFPLLGVEPVLGRNFTAAEEAAIAGAAGVGRPFAPPAPSVAILSDGIWRRRFGADRAILGRVIQVNGTPHEVVGVLPPDFRLHLSRDAHLIRDAHIWTPLRIHWDAPLRRTFVNLTVIGRLAPGTTLAQGQADLDRVAEQLRREDADLREIGFRIRAVPMHEDVVRASRPMLALLLAAALALLLVACANVAGLLLVRGTRRVRELSIRAALGASRARLLRALVAEGVALGALGAAGGILLAFGFVALLARTSPVAIPRLGDVRVDWTVLAFCAAAALLTALAAALAPALRGSRSDPGEVLRGGGRGSATRAQARSREALIVAELALSLTLLVGAGLLLRSLVALQRVHPGFDAAGVLTLQLSLPAPRYPGAGARLEFARALEARLRALPGVTAVGAVSQPPFTGQGNFSAYTDPARAESERADGRTADVRTVTHGYLPAVRTRLLEGRLFTPADDSASPSVAIIDQQIARELWPGRSAIGRRIDFLPGRPETVRTVVGVVEHVRLHELGATGPGQIYVPFARFPLPSMTWALRTSVDPASLAGAVRREVASLDPQLALRDVVPMTAFTARATADARFALALVQAIGVLAIVLATVGLYGFVSHAVGQRTREFGVRLALGATPGGLLRLVLGRGARTILTSVAVGLLVAALSTRLLERHLFGVRPLDAATFTTVSAFLVVVALLACWAPALRASRVAPAEALRVDA